MFYHLIYFDATKKIRKLETGKVGRVAFEIDVCVSHSQTRLK